MTADNNIEFTELGEVGFIALNRPQALNALNHEMIEALAEKLSEWEEDKAVQAVLIQGIGEKAFCAGGDIRKIYDARHDEDLDIKQFFWDEYRLNQQIFHYPKPYIALLNGITMGGGVGISIHGQYRIATDRFTFAMPETGIGFFPDVGGSYFLPRCPGYTGFYLGLTGARINAADALYLELVNVYFDQTRVPEFVDAIVTSHLSGDCKQLVGNIINNYSSTPPVSTKIAEHRQDIDVCFSKNTIEEIIEALQERQSVWCDETAKILLSKSPLSLKITLAALQRGKSLTMDQCMQMEYRLVNRFLQQKDFYEGIRAVIVDKDQKPVWTPATLAEVDNAIVEKYFAPLVNQKELNFIR